MRLVEHFRRAGKRTHGCHTKALGEALQGLLKPIAIQRRQLHPFFYRIGPVGLSICSVLLISLMAVLYLSQSSQAVTANQEIQSLRQQQASLQRDDQDLVSRIAQEQSPSYIIMRARAMGLIPADQKKVIVIVVPDLKPIDNRNSVGETRYTSSRLGSRFP